MTSERRVVLVTGASSGIGLACADKLAAVGFRVYGTSRQPDFRPQRFEPLQMDMTDDSVARGIDHVLEREGFIDTLINNAGFALAGAVEDTSIEEAKRQLETNVFGVLRACQAVLPAMRQHGAGLIVNISSLGGLFGLPFQGLYSASKFALEGLSESLRLEVRPFGIRVVLVEPGDTRTSITHNRVLARASGVDSAYDEFFHRVQTVFEKEEAGGIAPEAVAVLVARIVACRHPRVRYTVGRPTQRLSALIKRLVPSTVFERILLSYYGLAAVPTNVTSTQAPGHVG